MIKRYAYSPMISTGAVCQELSLERGEPAPLIRSDNRFLYKMDAKTKVYGLGEAMRGINKRGGIYDGYCSDDPLHTEDKRSLYGAHNFILVDGRDRFGAFFDLPGKITFDIGCTDSAVLAVTPEQYHLDLYLVTGDSLKDIVRQFRELIGRSYVPPLWAFGYGQSRWSYGDRDAVIRIADEYQKAGIPLDMIYLDIDYMERYQDFTVSEQRFPHLDKLVSDMKRRGIHLIPIIDAAVKQQEGYRVYEEGRDRGYFCKDQNGEDYVVGVWPGMSCLPDFLNPEASRWFGEQYKSLTDMGIDGFWNDMNEPALFYSEKGLLNAFKEINKYDGKQLDAGNFFDARDTFARLSNSQDDYNSFYHNTPQGRFVHNDVHNLYGYKMTQSATEALRRLRPDEPTLLFSRASYIGAHRYGGVWTGDNHSWWSHILQSLQQMPGLNMCGFLYSGSDIGGFNGNCTRELLIRWLSFAIFTPLMRNHAACGTRDQEAFAYGDSEVFRHIIGLRYRLIPYLYGEFIKAADHNAMFFRPLSFDYEGDDVAASVEDQLMVGDSLMIAPIYTQNAEARHVYLPENMRMIRMNRGNISTEEQKAGWHYISVPMGDVVFFTKRPIPLAKPAMNTAELDFEDVEYIG